MSVDEIREFLKISSRPGCPAKVKPPPRSAAASALSLFRALRLRHGLIYRREGIEAAGKTVLRHQQRDHID